MAYEHYGVLQAGQLCGYIFDVLMERDVLCQMMLVRTEPTENRRNYLVTRASAVVATPGPTCRWIAMRREPGRTWTYRGRV